MAMTPDRFATIIKGSVVDVYGGDGALADALAGLGAKKVCLFTHERGGGLTDASVQRYAYRTAADAVSSTADVCCFDGDAIKLLLAKFPRNASYALVRVAARSSWLAGLPGLVRRVAKGRLRIEGVVSIRERGGISRPWLVVKRVKRTVMAPRSLPRLSDAIGVTGFLQWLNEERIDYVVTHFSDRLPALHRREGELHLLVADADEEKILAFLRTHERPDDEGDAGARVQVRTVHGLGRTKIPHYPPLLATQMLASAVAGPAGARVPAPMETFLGLAYHCLYHEGFDAGIPSVLSNDLVNAEPEEDYREALTQLAAALDIEVPITLEGIDDYLHQHGWRPKLDTLMIIARKNRWVQQRFFTRPAADELGLNVIVLKEKAVSAGIVEAIVATIKADGFAVLRTLRVTDETRPHIAGHLRGGNWGMRGDAKGTAAADAKAFLPAIVLVVLDLHLAYAAKRGGVRLGERTRIRGLKKAIRRRFDQQVSSVIHATDTTSEAWEYVDVCFPGDAAAIEQAIALRRAAVEMPAAQRARFFLRALPAHLHGQVARVREQATHALFGIKDVKPEAGGDFVRLPTDR